MRAMILAAGLGTRMAPLTDTTPKPLLKAGAYRLIEWHLLRLVEAGVKEVVINHHYLGAQIEQVLGDGGRYGASILYSPEIVRLETAGGIIRALPLLGERFIVVNADIWTDFDFTCLPDLARDELAHLVLVPNAEHHPAGDFTLDAQGRADYRDQQARYTFSGISVMDRRLFADYPEQPTPLLPLLRAAMDNGAVSAQLFKGRWWDIGTPARLAALELELGSKEETRDEPESKTHLR